MGRERERTERERERGKEKVRGGTSFPKRYTVCSDWLQACREAGHDRRGDRGLT